MTAYSKASPIKDKNMYQSYLLYECGIRNCNRYHKQMIQEGYLELAPLQERVKALKVTDLKVLLAELGKNTTGKKDDLVKRVVDSNDRNIIVKYCPENTYSISTKGKEFLSENDAYIKLHRNLNWGVDWTEYDAEKKPGYSFFDIVWSILNKHVLSSHNFGRNEYLAMAQMSLAEGKRSNACMPLLRVLYFDISGTEAYTLLKAYVAGFYKQEQALEWFDAFIMLAPWVTSNIAELADVYKEEYLKRVLDWKLPVQIFTPEMFTEIVHAILGGKFDKEIVEAKLKKQYVDYVRHLPHG